MIRKALIIGATALIMTMGSVEPILAATSFQQLAVNIASAFGFTFLRQRYSSGKEITFTGANILIRAALFHGLNHPGTVPGTIPGAPGTAPTTIIPKSLPKTGGGGCRVVANCL